MVAAYKEATEWRIPTGYVEVTTSKFYGRHLDKSYT